MADRIRASDILPLLKEKLAFLSGGREDGGPILTFPSWQSTEKVQSEDLKRLILYLASVPSEEVLQKGFTVVIDMRASTWNAIKPILKVLQEHFPAKIRAVYIIKSDNFWQKQRTNFGSNKFLFEIHPVSVDGLTKAISSLQLTPELGGTLVYDHEEWIEVRIAFEGFIWDALDVLDKLHDIESQLLSEQFAPDQDGAKAMIEEHIKLKKRITSAPIEHLDAQGLKLLKRINGSGCDADSGFSGSSGGVPLSGNADFQSAAPRIHSLADKLYGTRHQLLSMWQVRKVKLDQCYQLKLFEQDANKMFEWIKQNRSLFVGSCTDIGSSFQQASDLQESHRHFATNSMSVYVNVHRVMVVANRLLESGHYATEEIRGISANLDLEWKIFAAALDERSRLMALAVKFHQRVERFVTNTMEWRRECDAEERSNTDAASITALDQNLQKHHNLHDRITEAYHDVCENGKELLDFLQKPASPSTDDVLNELIDYSGASQQVLDSIHEVFHHHRELEKRWNERKMSLAQKHQLRIYEHDVQQVLQWISEHGEAFLAKYTDIGMSLHRATQLRKRHDDFEDVAQNTYTNAEKLLEAAEQLAQSGDCDPQEIFQVARNLEEQIRDFARRVERRRGILDMSVSFNTNLKELWNAHEAVKSEMHEDDVADTLLVAEDRSKNYRRQRYQLIDSFVACQREAKNLLHHLRCASVEDKRRDMTASIQHVETVLRQLQIVQGCFEDSCSGYEMRLDLSLQFRGYEKDATEVLLELENWSEGMTGADCEIVLCDKSVLDQRLSQVIRRSDEMHIQGQDIDARAQELLLQLEQSDLEIVCSGHVSICNRVKELSEQVQRKLREVNTKAYEHRNKLEKCLLLRKLEAQSAVVQTWMASGEDMLRSTVVNLTNRHSADRCKLEYDRCTIATEKTRASVMEVHTDAVRLRESEFAEAAKEAGDAVRRAWQALARHNEERSRLILSASKFFQTADEVCSVLDSLQVEYKRPHDLGEAPSIKNLLEKHEEQKDRFLHACTLVRKLANEFFKHLNRTISYYPDDQISNVAKNPVSPKAPERYIRAILQDLLQRENQVLQLWRNRNVAMEHWQQYQETVDEMFQWLQSTGEKYLQISIRKHKSELTEAFMKEFTFTGETAKSRLTTFNSVSTALIDKDRALTNSVHRYQSAVQTRYNDFIRRHQQQRKSLDGSHSLPSNRSASSPITVPGLPSPPQLSYKPSPGQADVSTKPDSEEGKMSRRQNYIMKELLQTERMYVKDLEDCINHYMSEMKDTNPDMPVALRGQQSLVFGNMNEIHKFHSETFVKELEKYEQLPEDLGHCFVTWAPQFNLYVTYCQNKSASTEMLIEQAGDFFDKIQARKQLSNSIASYLIKPVQRITKYQLLLKDLASCCKSERSEIKDGLEVMLSVPRRANDALHLAMMRGFDEDISLQGDVIIQDSFQVLDTKQLIRKGRDRHLFLFELALIVCKETKDSSGKSKYLFKAKYPATDLSVQESTEAEDSCKFIISFGRSEKLTLKAPTVDIKQEWVKRLTEVIQEASSISKDSLQLPKPYATAKRTNSSGNILDDDRWSVTTADRWSESSSTGNPDSISLHSRTSFNSENVAPGDVVRVLEDYSGASGHLSVRRGQLLTVLQSRDEYVFAHSQDSAKEGLIPTSIVTSPVTGGSDADAAATSGGDASSTSRSKSTGSYAASTSTLPNEKRSGFRKWLTSGSKKKVLSGSATVYKIPEHRHSANQPQPTPVQNISPSTQNQEFSQGDISARGASPKRKMKGGTSSRSATLPASSVKHLVTDSNEEEYLPTFLPPPMEIVGNKLALEGSLSASACSLASNSSSHADVFEGKLADFKHSLSKDLRQEMEDILSEKFSKNAPHKVDSIEFACKEDEIWRKRTPEQRKSTSNNEKSASESVSDITTTLTSTHVSDVPETNLSNGDETPSDNAPPPVADKPVKDEAELALQRRNYVLMELCQTEKEYVADLAKIVEGYMTKVMERGLPHDVGKERVIFGNIPVIYEWHRDTFVNEINKCLDDPNHLGRLFKRYERRLHMYVVYCQNKPLSEYLVQKYKSPYFSDIQTELGTKLDIASYLIKPVQRIMKYQLLLKDFLKFTARAKLDCTDLKAAVQIMHVVPKLANDMMLIARVQGYPYRINAQGKLLLQDTFVVIQGPNGSEKERKVFFFEQSVVFVELIDKKNEERGCIYKTSIKNTDLVLKDVKQSDVKFFLSRRGDDDSLEMCSPSPQIKQTWLHTIKQQLDHQLDFLNALQQPISYQRQQLENTGSASINSNNNNNNNSNNNNRSSSTGTRPFLSSFHPTTTNINLNCELGGEVTTFQSSLGNGNTQLPSPAERLSWSSLGGCDEPTCPPPRSKQLLNESPVQDHVEERPRTPPFPVFDEKDRLSSEENSLLSFETCNLSRVTPPNTCTATSTVTSESDGRRSNSQRSKSIQPRPSSAAGRDTEGLYPRQRCNTTVNSSVYYRQGFNSHLSAPDLSASHSFWLSPLSPANIKSSTCKFIYPQEGQSGGGQISLPISQPTDTIRSTKEQLPTSEKKTVAVVSEDFQAVREDEVSVSKGDNVDIIATNAQGLCLVYRAPTRSTPAAEGWIPGHVINHVCNTVKKQPRMTPRSVKRNNWKKPTSSTGTLSRILRRSKSSDKLSDKSTNQPVDCNTFPHRHNISTTVPAR